MVQLVEGNSDVGIFLKKFSVLFLYDEKKVTLLYVGKNCEFENGFGFLQISTVATSVSDMSDVFTTRKAECALLFDYTNSEKLRRVIRERRPTRYFL